MGRYNLSPAFGSAAGAFIALSAWCTVYLILGALNPKRRAEWHCRLTTVIHAVLVCCMSAYAALVQGPWPFTEPGGENTPLQRATTIICLGYFLFDFAWCLSFNTEGAVMLAHHALTILGLSVTLFRGRYGTEMMAAMFGTEVTNPLLQLRWFLRETGRKHSRAAHITDVLFVLQFGLWRIGLGSYLLLTYLRHPRPDWLGKLGGITLYAIGWLFWVQICAYAHRKLFKRRPERRSERGPERGPSGDASVDHVNNCLNGTKVTKAD